MNLRFIGKRFTQAFIATFAILSGVYLLRGQDAAGAFADAALWSLISAAIFAGTVAYDNKKKNSQCVLCRDDAAMGNTDGDPR